MLPLVGGPVRWGRSRRTSLGYLSSRNPELGGDAGGLRRPFEDKLTDGEFSKRKV